MCLTGKLVQSQFLVKVVADVFTHPADTPDMVIPGIRIHASSISRIHVNAF
jgi:hypothetical protein